MGMLFKTQRIKKRHGRCYELAGREILENDIFKNWKLIHGHVKKGFERGMMDHAWLESCSNVWDPIFCAFFDKRKYYTDHQAILDAEYTFLEMAKRVATRGHWGPWHDD